MFTTGRLNLRRGRGRLKEQASAPSRGPSAGLTIPTTDPGSDGRIQLSGAAARLSS